MKISERIADMDFGLQIDSDIRREDADALRAQLARLLALVEAAEAFRRSVEHERYNNLPRGIWADLDAMNAALNALRDHGDI